ncbi:1-acyl-sn-glycerol-3-phosphate acyltransferase [Synechococcus sp. RSCCF101]|uniref:lysophospholipid acyltransferase family protein n=1 Tax=Synechococcus sp. RSCCF101 TaxID=2511069 RepID=UPI0012444343|nr:lysophospholipid acyltransferase family protein [Synechococcus sp. RSCCF101]QEY31633.1 1-acyl-sn-glycerol-3-phosphate acyltransferase [Synechococcus sp. RSCCF101]
MTPFQTLNRSASPPLLASRALLRALNTSVSIEHADRVPESSRVVVVSNHRSLLDVPLVMALLNRSVRFAAHAYMGNVPALREFVTAMGAYPFTAGGNRNADYFRQTSDLLLARQTVGIFPEGPQPMTQAGSPPASLSPFHRGFAHLAYRAPVDRLMVLPVAIASRDEHAFGLAPFRLFQWMDPSEPLFAQQGWHHATVYRQVHLTVGHPVLIDEPARRRYRGRRGALLARELTRHCRDDIAAMLRRACV